MSTQIPTFRVLCMCGKSSNFAAGMRQWWLHSIAIVLAVCFVWAGSGMNYVHYCCEDCRHAGIEHVLQHSCNSVHHHTPCHSAECCHHGNGCTFQRLEVSDGGISAAVHVPAVMVTDVWLLAEMDMSVVLPQVVSATENRYENTGVANPLHGRIVSIRDRVILI